MSTGREVGKRLVLTAVVALVVVLAATGVSLLAPSGGGIDEGPAHPEYDAQRLAPERLESAGQANPRGTVGVVLFDRTHGNRFGEEDVAPLARAIDRAGGEVRFGDSSADFRSALGEADVLVIVDPGEQYGPSEVDAIEQFVDDGGRVLILGEPNRKSVQQGGLQVALTTQRSQVTTVASRFGVSFGTQYLYDMEHNDGNFKNVVVSPPGGTDAAAVEGVEEVALYTAASVDVNRGSVLLRTARSAGSGNDGGNQGYPVAVRTRSGDVLAVGDTSFVGDDYHAIADNDVFIQRLVEFMTEADHRSSGGSGGTEASPAPSLARPAR